MSLEALITDLIAAVNKNTEALAKGGTAAPAAAAGTTKTETKPAAKPKAEHTREEMVSLLTKVKDTINAESAKSVIKDNAGVAKMADIPDDKIDAVYKAAKAKLEETADEM